MGLNLFLLGLSRDLYTRCQHLIELSKIDEPFQEIQLFRQKTVENLQELQKRIRYLQEGDTIKDDRFWSYAYYEYQDIARELALVEQFALPVLRRYGETDHWASRLIAQLADEFQFPQKLLPVATTTSNQYYWAKPELGIIGMPIGDVTGLLGWPDLMHEMAHIVLESLPNILEPFKAILKNYFWKKRESIVDIGVPEKDAIKSFEIMRGAWGDRVAGSWQIEFAANLIATYVFGPSFGWQHIRLSINHSSNPFSPSPGETLDDHPADQAQLECILIMLKIMGMDDSGQRILKQWEETLQMRGLEWPVGFSSYYPQELLEGIAQTVFDGCAENGLRSFTENMHRNNVASIVNLVHMAWQEFNNSSSEYPAWESAALENLKRQLG